VVVLAGYGRNASMVIVVIGVAKAFEAVSDIFYGLFQQRERMDRVAKSMTIKGISSVVVLGLALYLTGSVIWAALGLATVFAVFLFAFDAPSGATVLSGKSGVLDWWRQRSSAPLPRPAWDLRTLRTLTKLALPLGLVMMLVSLNTNVPRYVVERYLGERDLGVFAALVYTIMIGSTVVMALGQSATPRLARHYADGDSKAFWTLLSRLVVFGGALGVAAIVGSSLFGRSILMLLYGEEYARYTSILTWVMVAATLYYIGTFLGYGITATRAFGHLLLPYFVMTVVALLASVPLIRANGLLGAAWTLCATGAASCAMPAIAFWTLSRRRSRRRDMPGELQATPPTAGSSR
ncbi:MAG: oligosaccharide flippase family protein, partial [Actinomycetota bacterium]|nr:oligosaccharide flippase family protein [Actinomycetota bacterium]